jgi:hypothetical protein
MAAHRGRGILFGGVFDQDESEEDLSSIFYNDLYFILHSQLILGMRIKLRPIGILN